MSTDTWEKYFLLQIANILVALVYAWLDIRFGLWIDFEPVLLLCFAVYCVILLFYRRALKVSHCGP